MKPILEAKNIVKKYPLKKPNPFVKRRYFTALDNVSVSLGKKEILSVVGESGSGKTTLAKVILGLEKPQSGSIFIGGENLNLLGGPKQKNKRRKIQAVFQDPYSSLDPRMKIEDIILEPLQITGESKEKQRKILYSLLDKMSLAKSHLGKYPHEFSGGQRQRIAIARALAVNPEIIIADEPVSSLDISIQAQILNLLLELREEFNLSYIFISHDMAVVYHISDFVAVMNNGEIVESAPSKDLFENPLHPYTKILLESVPKVGEKPRNIEIKANADNASEFCKFAAQCPKYSANSCRKEILLKDIGNGHYVKCARTEGKNND